MFKVIIWASDGSDHADQALDYARGLAEADSTPLIALHVKEVTFGRGGGYPVLVEEEEVEQKIQRQVKELQDGGLNATYEHVGTTAGGAAHAIADAAQEAGADVDGDRQTGDFVWYDHNAYLVGDAEMLEDVVTDDRFRAYATVGEISNTLRRVWGEYRETSTIRSTGFTRFLHDGQDLILLILKNLANPVPKQPTARALRDCNSR